MSRTKQPPAVSGPAALDRLRALVEADGRPITDIAAAAGMARSQLSGNLNGVRRDPSISTVARILAALGRSWVDLDPAPAAATTTPEFRATV